MMSAVRSLVVREMALDEVDVRISYFHEATDDYLRVLGVDRALLPTREAWRSFYEQEYSLPIRERTNYALAWELDGEVVGFSTADHIEFGDKAHMHLHVLDAARRQLGIGTECVIASAEIYFRVLEIRQLFCEPNAFNVAPNRTLQRAGFHYLFTHEATPGPINFPQITTRWVLERDRKSSP
jgi:RimJ/RimL family protein N-acetyltransferase